MKPAIIALVIVALIAVAAFLYKNYVEQSQEIYTSGNITASTTACAQDAKVCPDGSAVGRTGPNCSFAACPPPNVSFTFGSSTIAFVRPAGFARNQSADGANVVAMFDQTSTTTGSASTITVQAYAVPAGQTAGQVMLGNTVFDPSGLTATSTKAFRNVSEGSNLFSEVTIGQFEGVVQSAYYLTTPTTVYRFDITERGVSNWTDTGLDPDTLPEHAVMLQMLSTVQISSL